MNREIKFRAWLDYGDGSGEMLPNIQNRGTGKWAFGHIVNGSVDNISNPMQFTGLTDKNGVEIYEGDVVSNSIWTCNLTVVYDDLLACWFLADADGYLEMLSDYHSESIIIGNIHQNPELLK